MIAGRVCRLRELREEDLALLAGLRNDLVTQAWSRTLPTDFTVEMMRRRYWDRDFSYHPESGMFIIEDRESEETAGFANYSVDSDRLNATIGVMVTEKWFGTGVPIEAVDLLLWLLFHQMGFEAVRLWAHSGNPRAVGPPRSSASRRPCGSARRSSRMGGATTIWSWTNCARSGSSTIPTPRT
jgi:RimJ/RimL family protein N-acetyltransferase